MDRDCVDAAAISDTQNSEAIKREMESVDNRKLFKEINVSTIPSSSLFRKVSLDIGRGKAVEIVDVLMGDVPFFLFQSKSNKKNYVVLLFWAADDEVCRILEKVQTISKHKLQINFKIESVTKNQREVASIMNKFRCLKKQNDDVCRLSINDRHELESITNLLRVIDSRSV